MISPIRVTPLGRLQADFGYYMSHRQLLFATLYQGGRLGSIPPLQNMKHRFAEDFTDNELTLIDFCRFINRLSSRVMVISVHISLFFFDV